MPQWFSPGFPAHVFAASAEWLKETTLQRAAFAAAFGAVWHRDMPLLTYPVAVGQVARRRALPLAVTLCLSIADDAASGKLDDLAATAFFADIAAMQHETQHSRIFRT